MNKIRLTTAQALVRFLDNQYVEVDGVETKFVKGIFAIFGHGNVLGLGQALEQDCGQLHIHQGRNEQGMAHTAIGFAKQSLRRQIYACTSSVGPGAANMVTAAATASANRIPLLLLPGDVYATRQPDPVLQQIEQSYDLSISTNDAFRAVSKYWDRIVRPEQLMTACISAIRVLTDPAETGAVTLSLPQDVQGEAYDYPDYFFQKRVHRIERTLPTAGMLDDARSLLLGKRKPLIICGGGAKYSGAGAALQAFAERFNIPFAETQAGKGTLVSEHPLNVGGVGETGTLAANLLAKEADLIIGIGTRYTDFTTSSKWIFQNPEVSFLNINVSRFDAFKLDGRQLVADAREALVALNERLQPENWPIAWEGKVEEVRRQLLDETDRVYAVDFSGEDFVPEIDDHLDRQKVFTEFHRLTGSVLTQSRVLGVLNRTIPRNAVIVAAAGSLPGDLQRIWRTTDTHGYHVEYGYSCMGYEVNAALGVKLAEPDREVYALVGDGSFMMLHSELVTSIQERRKINVVLLDNMTNGCINNLQMEHGMNSFFTEFRFRDGSPSRLDGGLVPVDFAKIAEGYGCKSYRVTTLEELHHALEDARRQTVSTLLDIKVLPKTMIHKYFSWWRVGGAEVSESESVQAVARMLADNTERARRY
ncbi:MULTISPECIES: 3D-(3,5/4)-trihydroxycyclohexane-1,2-dione acylhydrolase (decyclizing) [unclassified Brenneria]|uniref:3D-(3,5/4)-trihydroxycyclohexane-1,2-dione acylhydrolase (decyclizing) n=1 Tax=unclassified Brenneria TaxID=2634434 RepID=UPI001553B73B|nr:MULTISPECIES: 3D-(3,5/4)-trihydroxycyclohexane-1,2-dione acylhydrolase (decyclizing) [unclassified Brenneria]MBJ7223919.1 3D-(3,5/4)-trihydroxycyclohexane-1,2-dione acylhydrolase (decyclizing) [Brenneria sp. L3-3C-1]MEE3645163.1 3D-(3,5/4)-trihydroxycyclohexane-1,2-dione acylhydrolase (decyclizing) [Brenneria sp. L3_3C_1]MEE3649954.1 3D-(3,5/4)-trihydroxycyclohexane-1,2-dione acylhydrolase (decyclizing) [Brenneria sp. HEZEL_4_2_4]NPC99912.1 3D-(3,5/4)-trihydroxycyclohexane-1,2-dione acylhydr